VTSNPPVRRRDSHRSGGRALRPANIVDALGARRIRHATGIRRSAFHRSATWPPALSWCREERSRDLPRRTCHLSTKRKPTDYVGAPLRNATAWHGTFSEPSSDLEVQQNELVRLADQPRIHSNLASNSTRTQATNAGASAPDIHSTSSNARRASSTAASGGHSNDLERVAPQGVNVVPEPVKQAPVTVFNDPNDWTIGGNTVAANARLGSNNNVAIELEVNNGRALRLQPLVSGVPSIIGGNPTNSVNAAANGGTISGGGDSVEPNEIAATGHFGFIGGGRGNFINGVQGTVAGGMNNTANALGTTVCGGEANFTGNSFASIVGGNANSANGNFSTIGGGQSNITNGDFTTIVGGQSNVTSAQHAIAGGNASRAEGNGSVALGHGVRANALDSAAFGRYNVPQGNPTTWFDTDTLFVVDNGSAQQPKAASTER
jgi:hypothetical protein